jgi:hypothetical protein
MVAPAGGAAGDGNHPDAGLLKRLHGGENLGRQPSLNGEGVVNVGEHIADAGLVCPLKHFDRFHRCLFS